MRTAASIFAIGQWINGIVDLWCMNIACQLTPQRTYESEALQSRIDHRILAGQKNDVPSFIKLETPESLT